MITLSWLDLFLGALVLMSLVGVCAWIGLVSMTQRILIAALRAFVQLMLIGLILKFLFTDPPPVLLLLVVSVMLLAASYEIVNRQHKRFTGWWSFGLGSSAVLVSSVLIGVLTLLFILQPDPWYAPQYSITLLGILIGNTMNGITLGLDKLTQSAVQQRHILEARLMLGQTWQEAIGDIRRDSVRVGLIPLLNSMAAAGIITLPGMMTGQIMAGAPPVEAVKYQILIFFLIAAGTGFGTVLAVFLGAKRLFDQRERLRLDRLK